VGKTGRTRSVLLLEPLRTDLDAYRATATTIARMAAPLRIEFQNDGTRRFEPRRPVVPLRPLASNASERFKAFGYLMND
jgi:hypothetical protein